MSVLRILRAGPSVTVQDLGRPGHMGFGVSRGGAADPHAMVEGAALLGQSLDLAALEMAGFGGQFEATKTCRIALTGAPMIAAIDGQTIAWNASHQLLAGQILSIGAAASGSYGYLHVGGGIATVPILGSRATHLAARLGSRLDTGDELPLGTDPKPEVFGLKLPPDPRFNGGPIRILPSVQTDLFPTETRARFEATTFTRNPRGNRQGVALDFDGAPFGMDGQLNILSEPMLAGDIQMTGDGYPFVLLPECQTTGGYPRIGAVLPDDLPCVAQAAAGTAMAFRFISHDEALAVHRPLTARLADLGRKLEPLLRDPHDIHDLLSYQLISGAITGQED